jgi:hypothetical protein
MAVCILCAKQSSGNGSWFLLNENHCHDKLRVHRWERHLGGQAGVHHVCSAEHVLELVVHWMTTGSLDYPFARFGPNWPWNSQTDKRETSEDGLSPSQTDGEQSLGELSIDRESIRRILAENSQCLHVILAALLDALEPWSGAAALEPEERPGKLYAITHRA